MKNGEIAEIFENIADILDLKSEIPFKVNAYRRAARVLSDLWEDISAIWTDSRLHELPGIGDAFVKKISEYLSTGKMTKYESLKQEISSDLLALLKIQNLGPKTLAVAHKNLNVNNINDLVKVIENGQLAQLPKMGEKKAENIKKGIEYFLQARERTSIAIALPLAEEIMAQLRAKFSIEKMTYAGSVRRMRETVRDIDILAVSKNPEQLIKVFTTLPGVDSISGAGSTKASVRFENGLQVDLRVVPAESYGAALQYFTGSQSHNVKLRGLAKKKLLKINEYGIFRDDKLIGGKHETEIYETLGLPWIPPEMREDRGEVERALTGTLPNLVEQSDILGDLHVHTNYSDGKNSITEIANHARKRGYKYLAICDHSVSATYANGLSPEKLLRQSAEIDAFNESNPDFRVLKGTEVDIRVDGSLDYSDEILKQLDFVVASIHTGFKQNPTERIKSAMRNPYVDVIGHPTGRLISRREAYEIDINAIIHEAKMTGTALEINAHPERLDLSDINAKFAAETGVMIVINTDSHEPSNMDFMKYGVSTARRGWLTREHVLNVLSFEEVLQWRSKRINPHKA